MNKIATVHPVEGAIQGSIGVVAREHRSFQPRLVGSFLNNLGLGRALFSPNVDTKMRYYGAGRFIFSGNYTYFALSASASSSGISNM
jgi:hypothetical protein